MLVLTRRLGETIRIGDDCVVTVTGVQGDTVRLSIEAPRQLRIYREEVYQQIVAANAEAAEVSSEAATAIADALSAPPPSEPPEPPARPGH